MEFSISCKEEDLELAKSDFKSNNYIPIELTFKGAVVKAKMRIRGDTSRKYPKKSLKIKLLEKHKELPQVFNLNAEYEDKTGFRQFLSSHFYNYQSEACFKTQFAPITINGEYFGLYLFVENMGKSFLDKRGFDPKGNLYKGTKDGACLSFFDDIHVKWEKKTNKNKGTEDLSRLIRQINETPIKDFDRFLKNNFDYDNFINTIAMNALLANGSTYYHNYYMFHDINETGKWMMFPWDMDKSMRYYNWKPYEYFETSSNWESDNPLIEKAFLNKTTLKNFSDKLDELHASFMNFNTLAPAIDSIVKTIGDFVIKDNSNKVESEEAWRKIIEAEKNHFEEHYKILKHQLNDCPRSFELAEFKYDQTEEVTFRWNRSHHPKGKNIQYELKYGTDFLFEDSLKTTVLPLTADSLLTLKLGAGKYFWQVKATDGENEIIGFNSKSIVNVVKATEFELSPGSSTLLTKQYSPYVVNRTTEIPENHTLTIEPGVQVYFGSEVTLNCNGDVIAHGSKTQPINFYPTRNFGEWGGFYFYDTAKKGSFNYCNFYEGVVNNKKTDVSFVNCTFKIEHRALVIENKRSAILWMDKGSFYMDSCIVQSNGKGEGMVLYNGSCVTKNSNFYNCPDAIEYIGVPNGIIHNNFVYGAPDDAIDCNACNNVSITNNILIDNVDKAVSIGTEQYGPSKKNIIIKDNLFINNRFGVAVKDSSFATITDNVFHFNLKNIYCNKKNENYPQGGNCIAENNIISGRSEIAIYADELSSAISKNNIIQGKLITDNYEHFTKYIGPHDYVFIPEPVIPIEGDFGGYYAKFTPVQLSSFKFDTNGRSVLQLKNQLNLELPLNNYSLHFKFQDTLISRQFNAAHFIMPREVKYVVRNLKKHPEMEHAACILPKMKVKPQEVILQLNNTTIQTITVD